MLDPQTPRSTTEAGIKCSAISSTPCAGPSLPVCTGQFPHHRSSFWKFLLTTHLAPSTLAFCGSLYSKLLWTSGPLLHSERLQWAAFVQSSKQDPHPIKSMASSPAGCSPQPDLFLWQSYERAASSVYSFTVYQPLAC